MTTPSGYTRQAEANIQPNLTIDAEDLNAEFNQLALAMDNTSGHDHTGGAAGTGAKIALGTSVSGILPVVNGGTGISSPPLVGLFTSATPVTTANTGVGKMVGLGSSLIITPRVTGRVLITANASISNNSGAANTTSVTIKVGSGAAPATGAAVTGTGIATNYITSSAAGTADLAVPYSAVGIITGLTLATTYWIDLAIIATVGSLGTVKDMQIIAIEI